jgi:biotin synthase
MVRGHAVAVDPAAAAAPSPSAPAGTVRSDWSRAEVQRVFDGPLMETIFRAASVHRLHHDASRIQLCTLMNIKSECGPMGQ